MDTLFIYQLFTLFIVFLIMLNGYLRGRYKKHIDSVLGFILIILIVFSFIKFGWRISLGNIVGMFIYAIISRKVAKRVAYRLLGRTY